MKRTIFFNAQFITLDPKGPPMVEAVYVVNGLIVAMGKRKDIEAEYDGGQGVERVDLQGAYAYPGFVDSHMHLSMLGQKLEMIDFRGITNKEEMLDQIRRRATNISEQEWVLGHGWQETEMQGGVPSLKELDEASFGRPVFLSRICFHSYLANHRAAELAGVKPHVDEPKMGAYGREESGRWNGLVYENASQPFYEARPKPTYEEKKNILRQAMELALSLGLTAVHTEDLRLMESVADLMKIHQELRQEGISLRTHQLIYHPYFQQLNDLDISFHHGDEWFRIGPMKIFADGSLGSRTAWLHSPYTDQQDTYGIRVHTKEEMFQLAQMASKRGFPIAVHAIGDAAAEQVIETMLMFPASPSGKRLRHRLIHGQILNDKLIQMLKNHKIVVDIQPIFVSSDFPWVIDRVGTERIRTCYAWKSLIRAGVPCAGGSDAPIESLSPFLGMYAALTRKHDRFMESHTFHEQEILNQEEVLRLFTIGSAYAAGEEAERGTISVGKYADFTVVDQDLLQCDPETYLQTRVLFTITNGVIGFRQS